VSVATVASSSQGASGVGLGNFLEVGPLDVDLKPRNSTWLQKADLIFVVSQSSESDSSAPHLLVFFHTTTPHHRLSCR
jgi:hypothetical protein